MMYAVFCNGENEMLTLIFFDCKVINRFWMDLAEFLFNLINLIIALV